LLSANSGRSDRASHTRSAEGAARDTGTQLHDAAAQRLNVGFFSTIDALVARATHSARHLQVQSAMCV
jgi:predicted kinase